MENNYGEQEVIKMRKLGYSDEDIIKVLEAAYTAAMNTIRVMLEKEMAAIYDPIAQIGPEAEAEKRYQMAFKSITYPGRIDPDKLLKINTNESGHIDPAGPKGITYEQFIKNSRTYQEAINKDKSLPINGIS